MEIEYKGANCIVIKTKQSTIVVDPKLSAFGLKDQAAKATVQLATQKDFGIEGDEALLLNGPGEYEVGNISIVGVPARVYSDTPEEGKRATIYRISSADFAVVVLGHVAAPLTEEQLEAIGVVDIAVMPVGGNGYTLDAHGAVQVVRQLDPKVVIPTHYADKTMKYEVEQAELGSFVKELGVTPEEMPKLKLKSGALPDTLSLYVLNRVA